MTGVNVLLTLQCVSGSGFYFDHKNNQLKCQFQQFAFLGDLFYQPLIEWFIKERKTATTVNRFIIEDVITHLNMALHMSRGHYNEPDLAEWFLYQMVIRDLYKIENNKLIPGKK
jgi:hypothetical protein